MLSIGAMGRGQSAYYTDLAREDYYHAGGEPRGTWFGRGAEDLELRGFVQPGELSMLFEGRHPADGRGLIQNAGERNHQPGWDLTFSAPKSVSVLWSQADEKTRRIIQAAHQAAVKAALQYLEDACAITRRGKGGHIREPARLIAAIFEHGTSRAQDMQLHDHALIMNACTRADGTTGTIESLTIYKAKMALGALYRAHFAASLERDLGVTTRRVESWFEVDGVPQKVMDHFSKRAADVRAEMHDKGHTGAEKAAAAALATRQVKGHIARDELYAFWQERGSSLEWGPEEAGILLRSARTPARDLAIEKADIIRIATDRATQQQSYFTAREFIRYVAEESQGRGLDATAVRAATSEHLTMSPDIVRLGEHRDAIVYTTREMLGVEEQLLRAVDRSKTRPSHAVPERILESVIANQRPETFNNEQANACRHACGGEVGSIRLITGIAGSGKTTMLTAARQCWELAGFHVRGAALAGKTQRKLTTETGIQSDTIHRTIMDIDAGRIKLHERSVLVVDEAGMIGTRIMQRLIERAERAGARLVLTGERHQIQPIEAGGPLGEMEKQLGAATLTVIVRQREAWAREAVRNFRQGKSRLGLEAYAARGMLHVGEDRRATYAALVEAWKTQGVRAPETQLIFSGTRYDAAILNAMVQGVRRESGTLGVDSVSTPDGSHAFHVGDRLLFMKRSRVIGVENGDMGNVIHVDPVARRLAVRLDTGGAVSIYLDEYAHVRLGYAVTTHKGQGTTVERAYVLAGGSMQDREISYVQTSRARGDTRIFADRETAGETVTKLAKQMSVSRAKLLAHSVRQPTLRPVPDHALGIDI